MMNIFEKIEKICKGKNVRIFSARTDLDSVTFVESFRNCGKRSCHKCRIKGRRPHGPYWNMNYLDEKGKARTLYVGKTLPDFAFKHGKLLFSDVVRFYQDSEMNKAAIARYQAEILHLRKEVERLFEEVRSIKRTSKMKPAGKAEKIYKQLVVKYHPDRNAERFIEAEEVMKDINQLYRHLLEK
jgi:uncharacterized protein DUF6788/DnaJ-like protein